MAVIIPNSKTVAFAAAQVSQLAFGLGALACIRTLAYALPYDAVRAEWDLPTWALYFSATHRFWVYVLVILLVILQVRGFCSASATRKTGTLGWMSVTMALLVLLFANGLFVALRLNHFRPLIGS